ncbi:MAG: AAA family ATPase, partial [Rhodoluna sp.]
MPSFTPSLTELVNHGHSAPILLHDVMAHRQSIDNYPSASERRLVRQRSQLNLAILSNLADVARAIFPDAVQQNRRIESGSTRIYLDTDFDPTFPGSLVNPGYWMNGSIHDWCTPPQTGDRLTSLYARVRNVPEFAAEEILWNHLELVETFLPGNGPDGWIWETRPLIEPFHNPQFWFPRYSARPYLGGTNLPILWAVQDPSLSNFSIRYFSLFRRKNGQAIHWVEALPPGELPLFGAIPMTPDKRLRIRIVPSEFDPRIGKIGNETFCAVPGGAASLVRADLKALAGHYVYLELLPHELAHTPGIIDAFNRSKAAEVTFSLVGHLKSFPLLELREVASRHGHNFPLPTLPEPKLGGGFIAAGSPLQSSSNPRRMLLAPIIAEGGLTWLYASPKMGKTWLALSIAQAVSQGSSLGPWQAPETASVLYVDGEMHPNDLQSAIAKVARGQGNSDTLTFDVLCAKKTELGIINLLDPDWQKEIEKHAKQKSLVIFDTFYSLTRNIAAEFMDILIFLQKLRT